MGGAVAELAGGGEGGHAAAGDGLEGGDFVLAAVVEVVDVPGDGLLGDLTVAAEVGEGVGAGGGIVLLVGEVGGLFGGFVFEAEAAIEDGEVVVGGEVVGVDGLDLLVLGAGVRVLVLLVEGEAELAVGVAGAGEGGFDLA